MGHVPTLRTEAIGASRIVLCPCYGVSFYSITAFAPTPIGIEVPLILLDKGFNVFTAATDDMEGLLKRLADEGVEVKQVNCLDAHEPINPTDSLLLPGETEPPMLPSERCDDT